MGLERRRHSELGDDELECILRKLSFLDILRFKRVCRKWFRVAETYVSSSSYRPCFQAPWLVLPHQQDNYFADYEGVKGERCLSFFNPDEKRLYSDVRKLGEDYEGGCVVGSSHGWLVLLDRNGNLCVFNPFSDDDDDIHNIHQVGSLRQGLKFTPYDEYCVTAFPRDLVRKTVLVMSGSKFNRDKDGVVLIYGRQKRLAFYSCKDGRFMDLDGVHERYCDIICKDNKVLCALSTSGSVEMWDFSHGSFPPAKIMDMIRPPFPSKTAELEDDRGQSDCTQYYLVESCSTGELLFVVRFVETNITMSDSPPGETFLFHVYRLDREGKKWVEMESLGDEVVFLGRNQSMSFSIGDCPGCVKNSIYFTNDDTWLQNKDVGFYNLEDKSVKTVYQKHRYTKSPPSVPFWILPNHW